MEQDKEQKLPETECEISRRTFFTGLGLGSLGLATAGTLSFAYQYMSPNVLYEPSPIINAGNVDEYSTDSVTLHPALAVYVVRLEQGIFSLSAICTHLGCMTAWKPELNLIACPCHGSRFTNEGVKVAGPAPKPLPWLRTWLSDDRDVMVDRSTIVRPLEFLRV